jgi:hypothetical protein
MSVWSVRVSVRWRMINGPWFQAHRVKMVNDFEVTRAFRFGRFLNLLSPRQSTTFFTLVFV